MMFLPIQISNDPLIAATDTDSIRSVSSLFVAVALRQQKLSWLTKPLDPTLSLFLSSPLPLLPNSHKAMNTCSCKKRVSLHLFYLCYCYELLHLPLTHSHSHKHVHSSLDGLDRFSVLEDLVLDNNQLTDASLSKLPKMTHLQTLTLNKNQV